MKVFLDTNVILDFFMRREPFFEDAKTIIALGYNRYCELYVSSLSFSNIAYIARKKFQGDDLYKIFSGIREFSKITAVDEDSIDSAIQLSKLMISKMLCNISRQRKPMWTVS